MHRYYMTLETQQAVIAESNRLIAARAAMTARRRFEASNGGHPFGDEAAIAHDPAADTEASCSISIFARLVSDLATRDVRAGSEARG